MNFWIHKNSKGNILTSLLNFSFPVELTEQSQIFARNKARRVMSCTQVRISAWLPFWITTWFEFKELDITRIMWKQLIFIETFYIHKYMYIYIYISACACVSLSVSLCTWRCRAVGVRGMSTNPEPQALTPMLARKVC